MKTILMTSACAAGVLQLSDIALPELPSPHHLRIQLMAADNRARAPTD
jgi:hypothetical protein